MFCIKCQKVGFSKPARRYCAKKMFHNLIKSEIPRRAQICRKLRPKFAQKLPVFPFRTSEEGCAKVSQLYREFESKFRTTLCKYPFSIAPFFWQTRVYPYPLGAGSARPNPKMSAPDPENPFIFRVFPAQRGIETMVSDHGLGRGQTMG